MGKRAAIGNVCVERNNTKKVVVCVCVCVCERVFKIKEWRRLIRGDGDGRD